MDYNKCITSDGKNYAGIEKIIAERSYRDYKAVNGKNKKHKPYSLSLDTLEALEVKKAYLSGNLPEEEYKAYVLKGRLYG